MVPTLSPENNLPPDTSPAERSGLTYCLVHGSFHGSWCWELLRPELEKAGHSTLAVDLPLEGKDASYDSWSDIIAENIVDPEKTVLVAHSRMGNIAPRVASRKAIHQVIYLCAGFDPSNNNELRHHYLAKVPPKYNPAFIKGIKLDEGGRIASIDPDVAREVFYHDCPPEVADAAISHLKPMLRASQQPIRDWTDVPSSFIYSRDDRVIRREYSEYISRSDKIARNLGNRAIMLDGGHAPHLSRPGELANIIGKATIRNVNSQPR